MPSVLFINRVFPPDPGATGLCLADIVNGLSRRGWTVTVVAEGTGPSDPVGSSSRIVRTGSRLDGAESPKVRDYAGALFRLTRTAMALPRHDVVVSLSDPPLAALTGWAISVRWRSVAVHWCHDFYPPLLEVVAPRLPRLAVTMATRLAGWCLRRHEAVIAVGRCMAQRMQMLGIDADHLRVIPNWAEAAAAGGNRDAAGFRRDHGLENRFVVLYAGTLGLAHPLSALIDAARWLQPALPDVVFVVAGGGRGRAALEAGARRARLDNVVFLPWQPPERLSAMLSAADLHLVTLDERSGGLMVPRKATAALAAGRPCVFLGPASCEAARCIEEYRCGLVFPTDDAESLAMAVLTYHDDPERCQREGHRASQAATDWPAAAAEARFATLLDHLVKREGAHG